MTSATPQQPEPDQRKESRYGFRARLSDVRPYDVLLVDPDSPPDPTANTVRTVDGTVGRLAIVDFTNGTATAPITTDPFVWIAWAGTPDCEQEEDGPTCSICDGLGHGYPGAGPCPLEESGYDDGPGHSWEREQRAWDSLSPIEQQEATEHPYRFPTSRVYP